MFELKKYFEGWVEGLAVKDYALKDLIITDQLKRRASPEVKDHFLDERGKLTSPFKLSDRLDNYEMTRKPFYKNRPRNGKDQDQGRKLMEPEIKGQEKGKIIKSPKKDHRDKEFDKPRSLICYHCGGEGHIRPFCPKRKKDTEFVNMLDMGMTTEEFSSLYNTRDSK